MTVELILGIVYNILSLTYRVPQIFKMIRTKKVRDVSSKMLFLQSLSYVVSTAYGILENDWVWIVSSSLAFTQNIIIYTLRWWYLRPGMPRFSFEKETQTLLELKIE